MVFLGSNRNSSSNQSTIITTTSSSRILSKDQPFNIPSRLHSLRRSSSTVYSQGTVKLAHRHHNHHLPSSVSGGSLAKEDPKTLLTTVSRGAAEKRSPSVFLGTSSRDAGRAPQEVESRSYSFAKVLYSMGGIRSINRPSNTSTSSASLHMNGYDVAKRDELPVFKWTKVDDRCERRIAYDTISYPSNFHHVTHTKAKQFTNLTTTSQSDLVAEFSAVRASQLPRREIHGFKVRDIQSRNSSVDLFPKPPHFSGVPSLTSESSNSLNSPGSSSRTSRHSLWSPRSKESFSQPFISRRLSGMSDSSMRNPARTSSRPPSIRAVPEKWLNASHEHYSQSTSPQILELLELEDDNFFPNENPRDNLEITKNDGASTISCEEPWQIGIAISPTYEDGQFEKIPNEGTVDLHSSLLHYSNRPSVSMSTSQEHEHPGHATSKVNLDQSSLTTTPAPEACLKGMTQSTLVPATSISRPDLRQMTRDSSDSSSWSNNLISTEILESKNSNHTAEQTMDVEINDHGTISQINTRECSPDHKSGCSMAAFQQCPEVLSNVDDNTLEATALHDSSSMLRLRASSFSRGFGTPSTYEREQNGISGQQHEKKLTDPEAVKVISRITTGMTSKKPIHARDKASGAEHGTLSPWCITTTEFPLESTTRQPQRRHTVSQRTSSRSMPPQTIPPNKPLPDIPTMPPRIRRPSNSFMVDFPSPTSLRNGGAL